jgi:hypothetical protein
MRILDTQIQVREVAFSGDLVRDIEVLLPVQKCHSEVDFEKIVSLYGPNGWDCDSFEWNQLVDMYFYNKLSESETHPEAILLGCTHYSYLRKPLQRLFNAHIIDPSEEAAVKLGLYLKKHAQALEQIDTSGFTLFL